MKIKLVNNKKLVTLIDEEDFEKVSQYKWRVGKNRSGPQYASTEIDGKVVKLHRFMLGIENSEIIVDHINRDGLDNRKCNLRVANHSINRVNSPARGNKTGFIGVTTRKWNSYRAMTSFKDKDIYIGNYKTAEEAALARDKKVVEIYGSVGVELNFPLEYVLKSEHPEKIKRGGAKEECRKYKVPEKKDLHKMVWSKPLSQISKEIGCSRKVVQVWCENLGVEKPYHNFWQNPALEGRSCPLPLC